MQLVVALARGELERERATSLRSGSFSPRHFLKTLPIFLSYCSKLLTVFSMSFKCKLEWSKSAKVLHQKSIEGGTRLLKVRTRFNKGSIRFINGSKKIL